MEIGDSAPDINLQATDDQTINLSQLTGQAFVVYFYPKDSTPGCTQEGQDFRDLYAEFQAANTAVFGVSRDSVKSHERFREKHQFPFDLLADPEETLCQAFEVIKEKNMYGRKVMGIERSTFLFDEQGKLTHAWRKVSSQRPRPSGA